MEFFSVVNIENFIRNKKKNIFNIFAQNIVNVRTGSPRRF